MFPLVAVPPLFPAQNRLGHDAVPAPVGLVLFASPLGALLVGQVEPGTPALDPVCGTLGPVFPLRPRHLNRDVHLGNITHKKNMPRGFLSFVSYGFNKQAKGEPGAAAVAARARHPRVAWNPENSNRIPGTALPPAVAGIKRCPRRFRRFRVRCLTCAAWSLLRDRLTPTPSGGQEPVSVLRSQNPVETGLAAKEKISPWLPVQETLRASEQPPAACPLAIEPVRR